MPLICPNCRGSLKIDAAMELPPDSRSDEISLQILRCMSCGFEGLGVYEESRRGALDYESIDHRGYHVDSSLLNHLRSIILRCPEPNNPRCNCSSHFELKSVDRYGRWDWLKQTQHYGVFHIKLKDEE